MFCQMFGNGIRQLTLDTQRARATLRGSRVDIRTLPSEDSRVALRAGHEGGSETPQWKRHGNTLRAR